ncbi:hypothetical protein HK101_007535 [Irineochytrium annulatum]|nr:hypothetical protein HK101_007535 [Irineochytrium annulatum]
MDAKRKADEGLPGALVKRAKEDIIVAPTSSTGAVIRKIQRTSALQAPIMLLTGHGSEVLSCKFSPSGDNLASSSFDRTIMLWSTYGECKNYQVLKGHTGAVLEVQWSRDGSQIFSASTDKTLGVWDATTGQRIKKLKGHGTFVNTVSVARRGAELLASGSDDSTLRIWDLRSKNPAHTLKDRFQVTATCWSEDASSVFSGGIDNEIKCWDLRRLAVGYSLQGHLDIVTGLRVGPDGSGSLLSNAMDNTARVWDVKPFAAGGASTRLLKIFEGAPHGMEKHLLKPCWSSDGAFVAAGSADRSVVVWEVATRRIVYKLPGHKGCVTEVDWHPKEPIILSGSNDKTLFLERQDLCIPAPNPDIRTDLPYKRDLSAARPTYLPSSQVMSGAAKGVAIVFGAGPGLGAGVARAFAQKGYSVALMARTASKLDAIADSINAAGGKAKGFPADISESSIATAFRAVRAEFKNAPIRVAVYNASSFGMKPFLDTTRSEIEDSMQFVAGGFTFAQEAVKAMEEHGEGGTVLFTGASAGLRGSAKFTSFAVQKFGLRAISQSLAREYHPKNIHVAYVVVDGLIDTEVVRKGMGEPAGKDTRLNVEDAAQSYVFLHEQPRSTWTQELELRPFSEKF